MMGPTIISPEQRKIIRAPINVPLIAVTATAGAGKTQTLIERAAALVAEHQVRPGEILFLSFTRAAQSEVAARLKARRLQQVRVATLHSYALVALERAGHAVALVSDTQLEILGQEVGRTCLPARYGYDPEGTADYVLRRISYLTQQAEMPTNEDDRQLLKLFQQRFDELRIRDDSRLATYDQVLRHFADWLQLSESNVGATLGQVRHVIVDEAQDLSPLQYTIIRLLSKGRQLTLVGDPLQSIFSFQGSAPALLATAVQEADRHYTLSANHRSPASHIELSLGLFAQSLQVEAVKLHTPVTTEFVRDEQLADRLAAATRRMNLELVEADMDARVAVLVRSRREVKEVTQILLSAGLNVQRVGRRTVPLDPFTREWLLPCLDYLTLDRVRARHPLLRLPYGAQISPHECELFNSAWLAGVSPGEVESCFSPVESCPSPKPARTLIAIWQHLESAQITISGELADALRQIAYQVGIDHSRLEAEHLCQLHPNLAQLRLALTEQPGDTEQRPGTVLVSTIHAAKGREWPGVILTELPGRRFSGRDPEEYRLRYVAMTRSTHLLAAVLPELCHPAYWTAFQSGEMKAVNRIADLLSRDASSWTGADHAFVAERQVKFPHTGGLVSRVSNKAVRQDSGTTAVVRVPIRWRA